MKPTAERIAIKWKYKKSYWLSLCVEMNFKVSQSYFAVQTAVVNNLIMDKLVKTFFLCGELDSHQIYSAFHFDIDILIQLNLWQ